MAKKGKGKGKGSGKGKGGGGKTGNARTDFLAVRISKFTISVPLKGDFDACAFSTNRLRYFA